MGVSGIEIHHLEPDEDPIDLMLDLVSSRDGITFDADNDIVVNMLPGDIGAFEYNISSRATMENC